MAVSQIHLLPESAEALAGVGMPQLAFLCCVLGYSLLLFIDNLFKTRRRLKPVLILDPATGHTDEEFFPRRKREGVSAVGTLTVALAVHSLIEGMAIGVQERYYTLFDLGLAILFHKVPALFSYSLKLRSQGALSALAFLLLVCMSSPAGIALGLLFNNFRLRELTGVLSGLCSGTFLYITCQELVAREFSVESQLWSKFGCFCTGIATVVFTGLVFSED